MNNEKLENIINEAYHLAQDLKHEYVTVEHLSYALFGFDDIAEICDILGYESETIKKEIHTYISSELKGIVNNHVTRPKKNNFIRKSF